ncbi:hypothetical protein OGU21_06035 [Klebsiella oxytoca]|uniref:hypothetical protein n=1 Tax=Klebsiella oxytoca TaxID=571 RepID=UPI0022B7C485|nr:hypothetical protein [Klebsiella oxytoca]EIY2866353.1 hypothetical protein [Klebsiella oxytoca]EKQ7193506.1 hypothetical protein [Klebsiella oxytoca]WBD84248.1 hypothetical protein OGU21_06035 [Klebsiella oxytoca]
MGNVVVDIFPPAYWQDFERITLDIARIQWKDDYAERHGREGQAQGGVDVLGYNHNSGEFTGIQCKKRSFKTKPSFESPSNTLTTQEIDEELKKVKSSEHNLDRFIIATSGPRDNDLQNHVANLNRKESKIKVSIKFWDDYVDFLNNHPELMYRYYENILKYRSKYNSTQHYLHLLSMAFDRPALRTPFHRESRATDFISAISATQQAVSTGRLVDRENRIIDQVHLPAPKPKGLTRISNLLQKCRNIATDALAKGIIIEHPIVIEIKDKDICNQLNSIRLEVIKLLNDILVSNGIEEIEFGR